MIEPIDLDEEFEKTVKVFFKTKKGKVVASILILSFIAIMIIVPLQNQVPIGAGPLSKNEVASMLDNTDTFRGREVVELPIIIDHMADLQTGDEGINQSRYYAWVDATHRILFVCDSSKQFEQGDCVLFTGSVVERTRAADWGFEESMPLLQAEKLEPSTIDIVDPAVRIVEIEKTQTISGVVVTLHRIEFAKYTTRLCVTITNNIEETIVYDNVVQRKSLSNIDDQFNYARENKDSLSDALISPGENVKGTISLQPVWLKLKYDEEPDVGLAYGWSIDLSIKYVDDYDRNPWIFSFAFEE